MKSYLLGIVLMALWAANAFAQRHAGSPVQNPPPPYKATIQFYELVAPPENEKQQVWLVIVEPDPASGETVKHLVWDGKTLYGFPPAVAGKAGPITGLDSIVGFWLQATQTHGSAWESFTSLARTGADFVPIAERLRQSGSDPEKERQALFNALLELAKAKQSFAIAGGTLNLVYNPVSMAKEMRDKLPLSIQAYEDFIKYNPAEAPEPDPVDSYLALLILWAVGALACWAAVEAYQRRPVRARRDHDVQEEPGIPKPEVAPLELMELLACAVDALVENNTHAKRLSKIVGVTAKDLGSGATGENPAVEFPKTVDFKQKLTDFSDTQHFTEFLRDVVYFPTYSRIKGDELQLNLDEARKHVLRLDWIERQWAAAKAKLRGIGELPSESSSASHDIDAIGDKLVVLLEQWAKYHGEKDSNTRAQKKKEQLEKTLKGAAELAQESDWGKDVLPSLIFGHETLPIIEERTWQVLHKALNGQEENFLAALTAYRNTLIQADVALLLGLLRSDSGARVLGDEETGTLRSILRTIFAATDVASEVDRLGQNYVRRIFDELDKWDSAKPDADIVARVRRIAQEMVIGFNPTAITPVLRACAMFPRFGKRLIQQALPAEVHERIRPVIIQFGLALSNCQAALNVVLGVVHLKVDHELQLFGWKTENSEIVYEPNRGLSVGLSSLCDFAKATAYSAAFNEVGVYSEDLSKVVDIAVWGLRPHEDMPNLPCPRSRVYVVKYNAMYLPRAHEAQRLDRPGTPVRAVSTERGQAPLRSVVAPTPPETPRADSRDQQAKTTVESESERAAGEPVAEPKEPQRSTNAPEVPGRSDESASGSDISPSGTGSRPPDNPNLDEE